MTVDKVQKEVLRTLESFDNPATQKSIRQEVDCPKSTLSTKLGKLEENGYVVDESGYRDNSKQYVLADDVELNTNYRFDTFMDTQLLLYTIQTVFFTLISVAMVEVLNISSVASYVMYGAYILGVAPPLILYVYETVSSKDLLSIEVKKK